MRALTHIVEFSGIFKHSTKFKDQNGFSNFSVTTYQVVMSVQPCGLTIKVQNFADLEVVVLQSSDFRIIPIHVGV